MKIIDNFLPGELFNPLQELVMSQWLPWYYRAEISYDHEKHSLNSYLSHFLYKDLPSEDCMNNRGEWSSYFQTFNPILSFLPEFKTLLRAKINFYTRTETLQVHEWHIDLDFPHITGLLYFNNNDGYTEFKDGTKIESIANRFVAFDGLLFHRSTNCTNQKARFNMNINYIT
jgi:hypothetical protein